MKNNNVHCWVGRWEGLTRQTNGLHDGPNGGDGEQPGAWDPRVCCR